MTPSFHPGLPGLHRKLRILDRTVLIEIDKILPRNLTIRYIAALTAVGVLAVSGQLIVQATFARQSEDQKRISIFDTQIRNSENLRKTVLSFQSTSNIREAETLKELIESSGLQLQTDSEISKTNDFNSKMELHPTAKLNNIQLKMKSSLNNIIENSHKLTIAQITQPSPQSDAVILNLLNSESIYRAGLKDMYSYYTQQLENRIVDAKRIELLLLFVTLSLLVLEALYVFRPAVESLYDALRTRSDFLGRMGHEMRNPMNSILGMTHLLFETPLGDQQKKYLSFFKNQAVDFWKYSIIFWTSRVSNPELFTWKAFRLNCINSLNEPLIFQFTEPTQME